VSLARALSKLGACSRGEGTRLVEAGRVTVNGVVVRDPARRVVPERDRLAVDGAPVRAAAPVYLMLNKPRGLVTTRHDPRGRATVYDRLAGADLPFVGPVGRLDQASEGLLLFTNDTRWADAILDPASHLPKTYHVQVDAQPGADLLARLRAGVTVEGGEHLAVADVRVLRLGTRNAWLEVVLDEGRNRQIRRLLEAVGIGVLRLVRVAIGPLVLGDLAKGAWRPLTPAERNSLAPAGRPSRRR